MEFHVPVDQAGTLMPGSHREDAQEEHPESEGKLSPLTPQGYTAGKGFLGQEEREQSSTKFQRLQPFAIKYCAL